MTLNQILYFQKIANLENYHQAAEELYISQPSLSRSMASLENELGVTLFEKKGRGVNLTKAGRMFLEYADRILQDCHIATDKMRDFDGRGADRHRICVSAGRPLYSAYGQTVSEPQGKSKCRVQLSGRIIIGDCKKGQIGELDVGFGGCLEKDDMEFFPVANQKLVIITPKDHPLAGSGELPLAELNRYPVIGYDKDSWMGTHPRFYQIRIIQPDIIMECPDEYSIVALVREEFWDRVYPADGYS